VKIHDLKEQPEIEVNSKRRSQLAPSSQILNEDTCIEVKLKDKK